MTELATSQSVIGFATLVDLARLRLGAPSSEICDVCNTINVGSRLYCKGCSHKLPAFYAQVQAADASAGTGESQIEGESDEEISAQSIAAPQTPPSSWRVSAMDFAAFVVGLLLVWITEFMPGA